MLYRIVPAGFENVIKPDNIGASGISVGENPLIALTSELFLDSEPEAKTSHRVSGLPLTGSERNATMADRR
jgi:hypothetical protein